MKNVGIGHVVAFVLLMGTVIGILQPAYSTDIGLTHILISLFHPAWSQEFLMRWLLVIGFGFACYLITLQFIYRNTPITVVSTKVVTSFDKDGGAVHKRTQLLRANQPNVTAHISTHAPGAPNGKIIKEKARADALCYEWPGASYIELRALGGGGYEMLHIFDKPLPFSWYMPLIPTWILNREPERLFKFIRRRVVIRRDEMHYVDEYKIDQPTMNFTQAGRYRHYNLSIRLEFNDLAFRNFRVQEIQNNGVLNMQFDPESESVRVVRVDKMRAGTIRISWGY
jgi:hypothetical protein